MERIIFPNFNIFLLGKYFWNVMLNSNPILSTTTNVTISICLGIVVFLQPMLGIIIALWFFLSIRLYDEPHTIKEWYETTTHRVKQYRKLIYCRFNRRHFIRFDFYNKYSIRNKGWLLYYQYSWVDRNIVDRLGKWNH